MLTGHSLIDISREAENALSTEYLVVKLGSAETQVDVCGATDTPIGIAQAPASAGDQVAVRVAGISKAVASAAITAGAFVKPAASGKVAAVASAGDEIIGQALTAASGDGDIIDVLLARGTYYTAG